MLETFAVAHGVPALGYALVEHVAPRPLRRRDRRRARRAPGPERGPCRRGEPVTLAGRARDHSRSGARAARGPAARSCSPATPRRPRPSFEAAHKADVLVHEATFLDEEAARARETLHSTAADAAEVARSPT